MTDPSKVGARYVSLVDPAEPPETRVCVLGAAHAALTYISECFAGAGRVS